MNNIFRQINHTNGDILLEKINIDIEFNDYEQFLQEDGSILLKKKNIQINNCDDLLGYYFTESQIVICKVNDEIINNANYSKILNKVYDIIGSGKKITKNTLINIETFKIEDKCFVWLQNLGISYQRADTNKTIKEILNQSILNNISIFIKIRLSTDDIILIKNQ
jgi:hypothetical protein